MLQNKTCRKCKKNKNLKDFYKIGGKQAHLYRSYCKECTLKINSTEKAKKTKHAWRIKTRYNLEIEEYNQMFVDCENKCMICGIHNDDLKRNLCVDHNHETGEVRGLLCTPCNAVIGYAHEDIDVLYSAIKYLKKFNNKKLKLVQ